jgi:hypothetical protein
MIRLLVRLYPRRWRARFEDEFVEVLEAEGLRPRVVVDVVLHAVRVRLDPRRPGARAVIAVVVVALVERSAVASGLTDNLLWVPRGLRSAVLLAVVGAGLTVALVPLFQAVARRIGRVGRAA